MDDMTKGCCTVVAIVAIVFGFLYGVVFTNHVNEKQFIDNGYTREAVLGPVNVQWVKK